MTKKFRLVIVSGVAALTLAERVYAQDAPTASAESAPINQSGITDIVVTAQKRSENVNKVGMSITAASGDALQARGISDTADLGKVVPGFTYTRSSYGAPVYTLRGIGFYDTSLASSPAVTVYVDEVPLPYSILTAGAALDLERVEVLKGPQGTLFGQNSTGGAINYVAAKPTDHFVAGGDISIGRFAAVTAQGFIGGPLSSTFRARASVKIDRSDDWQRSYTRADTIGATKSVTGRLLLDWEPSSSASFRLNINGWHDRSDNQAAQFRAIYNNPARLPAALVSYPVAPADSRAADWDANQPFQRDNDFWQISLRGTFELGVTTLTSISAYQDLDRKSVTDADGTALQVFTASTPGRIRIFSQELRLAGDLGSLKWIIGGNYQRERIRDEAFAYFRDGSNPFPAADPRTAQQVRTLAAFGNLEWKMVPDLTLLGGLRYTDQRRAFQGCLYDDGSGALAALISRIAMQRIGTTVTVQPFGCATLSPQFLPGVVTDQLNEDNLSWRAGINWQAAPRLLVYANISRGYKSGAFPTAGATYSQQLAPATQESILAYEAGLKFGTDDRRLQLNAAAFYYDYTDKQFRGKRIDPVLGPLNALINIPKSRVIGAEVDLTAVPTDAITLSVGATHIASRINGPFSNFNAIGGAQNLSGEAFPLTPRWHVNADAEVHRRLSANAEWFAGASLSYQSRTNAGLGNLPALDMRNYALVDLRAGVRAPDGRWRIQTFARNVGNVYYWNYVSTTSADVIARIAGQPATYGVSLGWRF